MPELAETATAECVHHYVLGETGPDGSVEGRCKRCGAERRYDQRSVMNDGWRSAWGLGLKDPYEINREDLS